MDGGTKKDKRPNPRENANPLSAATFAYTIPIFIRGFKHDLEVSDLEETLTEHKSSRLGDKLERAWKAEEDRALKKNKTPSLRRALWRVFGFEFIIYGLVLAFNELAIRIIQPLALGQLIAYYIPNQTAISEQAAYLYAGGVILCSLANVFVNHPFMMGMLHLGMKMRVACCSLIYRKALKLSKTALRETTAGQVVNLLSNDVNRFDIAVLFAHQLWVGPLQTILVTYFMYEQVGVSAVIGVLFLLMFIPLQIWLGKMTSILRLKTAIRTDERVRLMNEIISGIQVIKMYTWERPFAALVELARKYEIKCIRLTSFIRGILLSFIMFTTRISIFASILAYVLFGYSITAEQVFVLTSFYNILRQSMTVFFPQGIAQVAEANVSIKRLNQFMMYDETELASELREFERKQSKEKRHLVKSLNDEKEKGIFIRNATAKWTDSSVDNTLTNVTLSVKPGQLLAVIGPVGSGKSSLLHAILKELPLLEGSIDVFGEVSYASQEPWLFAGSVRQNILFGQPMDKERYRYVVKNCALERDFSLFPYGDKTIVGERGVSLSGGQRARINLARAVYKDADIYLLDDPLSAVDTHVGKDLFENCVNGVLRNKIVVLITHQLQYLKEVDHIVILENGCVKAEGNFNHLQDSGLDFAQLLEKSSVEEIKEEAEAKLQYTSSKPVSTKLSRQESVRSATSEKTIEEPAAVEEQKSTGTVSGYVYKAYFKAGGNCCVIFNLFFLFMVAQFAASAGDYFITYWVNLEQKRAESGNYETTDNSTTNTDVYSAPIINIQSKQDDTTNTSTSFWDFSREISIYIYSGITAATIIITLIRSFVFFIVCMNASTRLHNNMFKSITHATMRFFNTNTSGRILNRFSKDMGAVDELLPSAMVDCLQIGLALIGIVIVVAIVNYWLLIPTFVIGVIFYLLRNFYLETGRSIKRLEGVTRSPVFAHLNASLQGLTTIRAFRAEQILEKEFDNHQDLHSSAWFNFIATSRAFGYWLDLVCIIYITIVTLSFLLLGNEKYGGNVGLAITQSIALTGMFQWGMRQSTELENQMTSVERVLEYTDVEKERSLDTPPEKKPPRTWPEHGEIKFHNVFLKYSPNDPPVLKNLSFTVKPQEKVGIVGRTGAGKSSLIAALFQLTDTEGRILIDNINIREIGLHDLRSKISIIPQEPVLFSGTMRKNLDPFDEYSDDVLWRALEDVELKEAVMDLVAGLESKMSEGGTNFSVGQRQLVCLARAIIRNNKILVLDEATANVDPQTDALIQTTIRKKFADCTVLTIAHRLHTVMDSDKVLVMDAGTMVEFDHPFNLLQNEEGVLYGMVKQTGKAMAEALFRIAEQSFRKLHRQQSQTQ